MQRPRLLPILIAAAALLFCAKLADIWFALGTDPVAEARAQATPEQKPAATASLATPKTEPAAASPRPAAHNASQFSPQEVQVLQALAQRRDALDKRAFEIDQREALLQAT